MLEDTQSNNTMKDIQSIIVTFNDTKKFYLVHLFVENLGDDLLASVMRNFDRWNRNIISHINEKKKLHENVRIVLIRTNSILELSTDYPEIVD